MSEFQWLPKAFVSVFGRLHWPREHQQIGDHLFLVSMCGQPLNEFEVSTEDVAFDELKCKTCVALNLKALMPKEEK